MSRGVALIKQTLSLKEVERVPWVPFVGVHGAHLIGVKADEYLQSADLILKGLQKAKELYQPDGLPAIFDLQLEAEALGTDLHWADEMPPSVVSHPLERKSISELSDIDFKRGRFSMVGEVVRKLKDRYGDELAVYGLVTGPFTLAMHLLGNDLFLKMILEAEFVHQLLHFTGKVAAKTALFYLEQGADVIALVDPMTSQISPEHFSEFVTKPTNQVFELVQKNGKFSSFFVCGDASRNLELMFQTWCDYVSIDENISLARCKELSIKYHKAFGGNLKLTSVLLFGSEEDCKAHALECLETGGNRGFILSPGCDLPFGCPPKNLQAVAQMVHDSYQRSVFKQLKRAEKKTEIEVRLPDYQNLPYVLLEVVTLDSASCAPCQYMVAAAQKAAKQFGSKVKVVEHKISTREGLAWMQQLAVRSIPSLCLDGQVVFSSIIPDRQRLKETIIEFLKKKGL